MTQLSLKRHGKSPLPTIRRTTKVVVASGTNVKIETSREKVKKKFWDDEVLAQTERKECECAVEKVKTGGRTRMSRSWYGYGYNVTMR
jgi:hypothetical protein